MNDAERKIYLTYMEESQQSMLETLEEVSEEAFLQRPDEDTWTVAEVVEHVVSIERGILLRIKKMGNSGEFSAEETPQSNEELLNLISSRELKVKAPEAVHPKGRYTHKSQAVEAFTSSRKEIQEFIQTTELPLEKICFPHPRFGVFNGYNWLVFLAGHSLRHVEQIRELI